MGEHGAASRDGRMQALTTIGSWGMLSLRIRCSWKAIIIPEPSQPGACMPHTNTLQQQSCVPAAVAMTISGPCKSTITMKKPHYTGKYLHQLRKPQGKLHFTPHLICFQRCQTGESRHAIQLLSCSYTHWLTQRAVGSDVWHSTTSRGGLTHKYVHTYIQAQFHNQPVVSILPHWRTSMTHYESVIVEPSSHSGQQRKHNIPKTNLQNNNYCSTYIST